MANDFTWEEIKNSVEYRWRKRQINTLLIVWGSVAVITFFFVCFMVGLKDLEYLGLGVLIWLGCMAFYGLLFGSFILFYFLKNRYLLKNYKKFHCYEVVLDNLSTSYIYTRSISYTVTIVEEGNQKQVVTNPYFSSSIFSEFTPEEFNNKRVVGLYDSSLEKFYIVKKVN